MITKYKIFESIKTESDNINYILNLPLSVRKDIKTLLTEKEDEIINESLFSDLKFKLKEWVHDKMLLWLLNQSEKKLNKTIDLLNVFDPTDFSNIRKCESIYLGGGIDKTPDEYVIKPIRGVNPQASVGTREGMLRSITDKLMTLIPDKFKSTEPERFVFIVSRGTNLELVLDENELNSIELIAGGGSWRFDIEKKFGDEHVVSNEDLMIMERTGVLKKNEYEIPLIINPLRKEQSVRDDEKFKEIYAKWKSGKLDKEQNSDIIKYMAKVINRDIKPPDLRLLNICDTNLVKYDAVAGDGTKGELQFGALKHYMNLFLWLDGGYKVKDISIWTFPEVTKIIRNKEELNLLIDTIKKFNNT